MSKFVVVFVTVSGLREARKIARGLLQKKLAACVNIVSEVESLYWWQGKIAQSSEKLLIIKTERRLFAQVEEFVKKSHSYSLPEIIALPIEKGSADYLRWVKTNLK